MLKVALIFLVVIAAALGKCQNPKPVKNFRKDAFSGSWRNHVVVGRPIIVDVVPPCVAYKFSGSGKYNIEISWVVGGKAQTTPAIESSSQGGSFELTNETGKLVKFVVLDTDYENYATLYFCSESNSTKSTVEVFLRSKERSVQLIEKKLSEAEKRLGIYQPRVNVQQSNCIN